MPDQLTLAVPTSPPEFSPFVEIFSGWAVEQFKALDPKDNGAGWCVAAERLGLSEAVEA